MAQPTTHVRTTEGERSGAHSPETSQNVTQRKLSPLFVDDVTNISIAPKGVCRSYFSTWSTGDDNKSLQVKPEDILTIQSLIILAEALPKAIEQAESLK